MGLLFYAVALRDGLQHCFINMNDIIINMVMYVGGRELAETLNTIYFTIEPHKSACDIAWTKLHLQKTHISG